MRIFGIGKLCRSEKHELDRDKVGHCRGRRPRPEPANRHDSRESSAPSGFQEFESLRACEHLCNCYSYINVEFAGIGFQREDNPVRLIT